MKVSIPCSEDQIYAIEQHIFEGAELGMQPDERAWILSYVRKHHGGAKVLSANLDIENCVWELELDA